MLLTLTATSLRSMLTPGRGAKPVLTLPELPAFTRERLGLHGLNLGTPMLAGQGRAVLEAIRDRADKARCAVLVLIEPEPQPLGDPADRVASGSLERLGRVIEAARVLGCGSVAITPGGPDDPAHFERTAERLRRIVDRAEKLEMNLLIAPGEGLTVQPERVTDLIKKVGGFRLGTFPDFEAASRSPDPAVYLRRLTPYAAAVSASTVGFEPEGRKGKGRARAPGDSEALDAPVRHVPYDVGMMVDAVQAVGYDATLAVDYRGEDDPTVGVVRSRRLLERLLGQEPTEE